MLLIRSSAIVVVFCMFTSVLFGTETKRMNISFTVVSLDIPAPTHAYYYSNKNDRIDISFKRKLRSENYNYEGPPPLSFLCDQSNRSNTIANIIIKPRHNQKKLLLLFSKNGKATPHESQWHVSIIEDDIENFSSGELMLFNASGIKVLGLIKEQEIALRNREFKVFNIHDNEHGYEYMDIKFAAKFNGIYELIYNNLIAFDSSARAILVLRPPRRKNSILIDTWILEDYPKEHFLVSETALK